MGSVSSSISEQISTLINDSVYSTAISVKNTSGQACVSSQNLTVGSCPSGSVGGDLNVTQKGTVFCTLSSTVVNDINSQIVRNVSQALDTASKSNNQALSGFLSTSINVALSRQTIKQFIENTVKANTALNANNTCENILTGEQKMEVPLCITVKGNANITQDLQVTGYAQCLTQNIMTQLMSDTSFAKALSEAEAKNKASGTGIGTILIVVAVIVGIIIVGVLIFMILKPKTASNIIAAGTTGGAGGAGMAALSALGSPTAD